MNDRQQTVLALQGIYESFMLRITAVYVRITKKEAGR